MQCGSVMYSKMSALKSPLPMNIYIHTRQSLVMMYCMVGLFGSHNLLPCCMAVSQILANTIF